MKKPRLALLKTPGILMTAPRGSAKSPTAEGDAGAESEAEKAESNDEDDPCEEDGEEQEG